VLFLSKQEIISVYLTILSGVAQLVGISLKDIRATRKPSSPTEIYLTHKVRYPHYPTASLHPVEEVLGEHAFVVVRSEKDLGDIVRAFKELSNELSKKNH
jgi:hypothetical protein